MSEWKASKLPNGVWEVTEKTEHAYRTIVRGITQIQAEKVASEHNSAQPADEIERLEKLVEAAPYRLSRLVYILKDRYDERRALPEIEALVQYHSDQYESNKSAGMDFMTSAEKALESTFSKALR